MSTRSAPQKFEVVRGAVRRPLASIVTGRSGIGKTYFCSTIPTRFFICVEQGLQGASPDQIESLARFESPRNLAEFFEMLEAFKSFAKDEGHRHLVVDSLSGLEALVHRQVCGSENVAHMDAKAYKAVWTAAMPLWQRIQRALDSVRDIGVHVWVIAHSQESTEAVETGDTFTKYDLAFQGTGKSLGEVRQMWRAWPDNVFFLDWQAAVKQGKSIGQKAVGVYKSRIIWTKEQPRLFAKSRLPLAETLPASWADLERAMKAGAAIGRDKAVQRVRDIVALLRDADVRESVEAELANAKTSDALAAVLSRAQGLLSIQQMEDAEDASPELEKEEPAPALKAEEAPPALPSEPEARPAAAKADAPDPVGDAAEKVARAFPEVTNEVQDILDDSMLSDTDKLENLRAIYRREKRRSVDAANDQPPVPPPARPAPPGRKRTIAEQKLAKKAEHLIAAIRRDEPGLAAAANEVWEDYTAAGLDALAQSDLEALVEALAGTLEAILNGEVAA